MVEKYFLREVTNCFVEYFIGRKVVVLSNNFSGKNILSRVQSNLYGVQRKVVRDIRSYQRKVVRDIRSYPLYRNMNAVISQRICLREQIFLPGKINIFHAIYL